ncbi:MAG: hypothetical protein PHF56_24315 [Desulfuromonadaceae bacterium]|nr:hypothetical protein [Desulfuromonadaceae bacterium]
MSYQKAAVLMGIVLAAALQSGCAGTLTSKYTYNNNYKTNAPVKDVNCYDASILLGVDLKKAREIGERVIVAVDATLEETTETTLKAQRNRHIGLFVGSGGEELGIKLQPVDANNTFATITTKTGLVGGAGQRAWSCEIVDKMAQMAAKK